MNKPERPPIQWAKSPDGVFEVYANMTHIMWSLDDVRVRLGQLVESPETPNPGPDLQAVAEERAAVTFTWRGAKIFQQQLATLIATYEEENGTIKTDVKLPPPKE